MEVWGYICNSITDTLHELQKEVDHTSAWPSILHVGTCWNSTDFLLHFFKNYSFPSWILL